MSERLEGVRHVPFLSQDMDRLIMKAWSAGNLEEHARLCELSRRVVARRAADAAGAGRALDALLRDSGVPTGQSMYNAGWSDGYAAAGEHHNRHYGPSRATRAGCDYQQLPHAETCPGPPVCSLGRDPWADAWPDDPCANGCPDPARHAEGGHDV